MHWPHPFLMRQGKRHHTLNIGCPMPVPILHSVLTQTSQKYNNTGNCSQQNNELNLQTMNTAELFKVNNMPQQYTVIYRPVIFPGMATFQLGLQWNHRQSLHWSWVQVVAHPTLSFWKDQFPASDLPSLWLQQKYAQLNTKSCTKYFLHSISTCSNNNY